ncbi:anti-sigma factor RsbA family regulatory protein [Blastococcus deserti]|uniref:Anti-sigma factor RsbA family regulatory protein n=1 Tax=Blastococcus deserti TaxID=2259033 RepID=A0ABW4X702_9ACTN
MEGSATECSSPASPGRRAGTGARPVTHGHAAAVVGSEAELLAVALPFLDAGLRAGDLVVLTCPSATAELVSRELGEKAGAVESDLRMSLLGARAPDALTTCRRYLERAQEAGSGRLRVLADVDFGEDPANWREGQRFESIFNRFMGDAPVDVVCLYDRRRLPAPVVDSAPLTHPLLADGSGRTASPSFQDPGTYVPSLPLPRAPVEDGKPVFAVDDVRTLAGLRHQLGAVIASLVPDRDQQEDLHLAASEIAANAFRHGARPVSARVWGDGDRIVCVISDGGTSYGDPLSGFVPAHGLDLSRGGMGLWLARKLWDHVDVLPGPAGLSVRLSTRLR